MSGFVAAVMEEFKYGDSGEPWCSPTLDLGDCSNKISFDFYFYNEKDMKKALKKVRLLREAIAGFADAFEEEVKKHEARPKEERKRKTRKHKSIRELIND